ncbi:hypothetical protein [Actinopolymorpha alba]|uniref:hypothetical protein n=1 Tax=Actinopolymorpha alba TaxID=533267 RepID=UPI00058F9C9F|nr:hypothetical protein [Actinopolymorpha alba]
MTPANIAQGNAQVGVQANVVHGNINNHYQLPPGASPEDTFRAGVRCLDVGMLANARQHIEKAVARGHETDEVRFHWLLALLSGQTLRQLSNDDQKQVLSIRRRISCLNGQDEWTAGLRVVRSLLDSPASTGTALLVKQLDQLAPRQRGMILDHLEVLLEGPIVDEIWQRAVERAIVGREAGNRKGRAWKFFHPTPAHARVLPVQAPAISVGDWLRAAVGTASFLVAAGSIGQLLLQRAELVPILAFLTSVVGLAVFGVTGAEWRFRAVRLRAKDAQFVPPQQRPPAPAGGFARKVDRLFDRYFALYVPADTDYALWRDETAGIQRQLRDELVEIYREQRIDAEEIAWLVRHLVGDVRRQWEKGTLIAYVAELRTPFPTKLLCVAGLAAAIAGGIWAASAAVLASPLRGAAWIALAILAAANGMWAWLHITTERRQVEADKAERVQRLAAREQAYDRWSRKLSDRPTEKEMAAWLEYDRKIQVDESMRHYGLKPSHVIAHAFIEAPAKSYKRARVSNGPWRYSRYRLLLFLLTDDGVRHVDIDLNSYNGEAQMTQRLNYRFDAVASVGIDGLATQQQKFELTLVSGEPISVPVTESSMDGIRPDEDPEILSQITIDASGLGPTLYILEGIAAEGKEWIKRQHQRADGSPT